MICPPARLHILKVVCARLRTEGSFDLQASARSRCLRYIVGFGISTAAFHDDCPCSLQTIAHLTPGFVGADLEAISKEASTIAVKRIISRNDLAGSQVSTQPCACPAHVFTRVCFFRSFPVYAAHGALPRRLCLMTPRCKELTRPQPAMRMTWQLLTMPVWLLAIARKWRTHRARLQTTRRCRITCRRSSSSP
jgi:SpoVK/Ycf46/Vps4 family AAA+-type ATPase